MRLGTLRLVAAQRKKPGAGHVNWLRGKDLNLRPSGYEAGKVRLKAICINYLRRLPTFNSVCSWHNCGTFKFSKPQFEIMDALDNKPEQNLVDEVLRRIGRNLLLFQQIEGLLKRLLGSTRFAGYASELRSKQQKRQDAVSSMSLGQLQKEYVDQILGKDPTELPGPKESTEIYFRHSFSIEMDPVEVEREAAVLAAITEERNHLAHTFLTRWNLSSACSTDGALVYLDEQRSRALPVRDNLQKLLGDLADASREGVGWLESSDGRGALELAWLQSSKLISAFVQIADTSARSDGWTLLSKAGDLVSQMLPDERQNLAERYGHTSLKRLLVAADLFEVKDEPLPNGGSRTIYRLKQQS